MRHSPGATNSAPAFAPAMSILGVIVRTQPARVQAVRARLQGRAGVEIAADPGDGRLILVIEDSEAGNAADALAEVALWPEVLNTSLVYEYSGPDAPAVSNYADWRDGLKASAGTHRGS